MGYEQMELDVTLTCDRELKDNVGLAVEFACRQIAAQNQKVVESNHEGYGIAAEGKVTLTGRENSELLQKTVPRTFRNAAAWTERLASIWIPEKLRLAKTAL